jgi:hypothetical protein
MLLHDFRRLDYIVGAPIVRFASFPMFDRVQDVEVIHFLGMRELSIKSGRRRFGYHGLHSSRALVLIENLHQLFIIHKPFLYNLWLDGLGTAEI